MAEHEQEEEGKLPGELASNIVKLSEFLDPHLREAPPHTTSATSERWSRRRAAAFILAASILLWGIIIALIHYL